MWQYNGSYGGAEMRGWLWVQGCWTWGAALTWHLHWDSDWVYDWVCYLWEWNSYFQRWDCIFLLSVEEPGAMTMPYWMVHFEIGQQ